ncbi:MAG TPA: hypothetical protein VMN57_08130 [Anaerolineales bacterium]|nr:hypothetical protein [Anaerolineales bacterium]
MAWGSGSGVEDGVPDGVIAGAGGNVAVGAGADAVGVDDGGGWLADGAGDGAWRQLTARDARTSSPAAALTQADRR